MPIQIDQRIFPHITPPPPDREEDLFDWARDISAALDELNRQVVDKYNLHIRNTHAHPEAWKFMRVKRPAYYNATDGGTTVTIDANVTHPKYFFINGQLYEATSSLTCDLSASGVGGLDTGSVAANTPYYLYGVNNAGAIGLIASASDPNTGPTGYTYWTYIGALATKSGSAVLSNFKASNGYLHSDEPIDTANHTGDTTSTAKTLSSMPVTVDKVYIEIYSSGAEVVGTIITASGQSTNFGPIVARCLVAGSTVSNFGFVPIFTDQTVYLRVSDATFTVNCELYGWIEDPTEWP